MAVGRELRRSVNSGVYNFRSTYVQYFQNNSLVRSPPIIIMGKGGLFTSIKTEPPFAFLGPAKPPAPAAKGGANPAARPTTSPIPALEWVNAYGEILSWRNKWAVIGAHWALFPWALAVVGSWSPSAVECLLMFLSWLAIAAAALTMNHRYFAHCSFKTSRPFRFLCACVACLGLQYGPMWWSSKHRKHHKVCDAPGDPHSWPLTSWWYAWFGWAMAVEERNIEVEFLHASMLVPAGSAGCGLLPAFLTPRQSGGAEVSGKVVAPELLLLDTFWFVPSIFVYLGLWLGFSWPQRTLFFYFVGPSLAVPLPILLFNVMFHPPDTRPTKAGCYALDSMLDPLTVRSRHHHPPAPPP